MIIAKVCKEWPEEKETPLFGKNSTEGGKLMAFINQLAIDERFTYQKYGLGRNAIKDMILTHLRKRRRAQREDATLLDSTGVSTVSPSSAEYSSSGSTPPPSLFDKKGKNMCPISTQVSVVMKTNIYALTLVCEMVNFQLCVGGRGASSHLAQSCAVSQH